MKCIELTPRANWISKVRADGCLNPVYESERDTTEQDWNESRAYVLTSDQVEKLRQATDEVTSLIITAMDSALGNTTAMKSMGIPPQTQTLMKRAWMNRERNLAIRLKWSFEGDTPKLLSIDADALDGFVLGGPAQRHWLNDVFPAKRQWNDIEVRLTDTLGNLGVKQLAFAAETDDQSMLNEIGLFRKLAGNRLDTRTITLENIGYNEQGNAFVDMANNVELEAIYAMASMSLLVEQEFAEYWFAKNPPRTRFFEPIWVLLPSSKAFMAWLYNQNPSHPNLLPTFLDYDGAADVLGETYVRKPIWGVDGANVEITVDGKVIAFQEDAEADTKAEKILQQYCPLPSFGKRYAVISTWIIGGRAAGLTIRDGGLITDYFGPTVPHVID